MNRLLKGPIICFLFLLSCQNQNDWNYSHLFWGFAIEGFPITEVKLEELKKETGIQPEVILFYMQWSTKIEAELKKSLANIWQQDAVPCMTWEPMLIENDQEITIPYAEILNGKYDHYLATVAEEIKGWDKPVLIRFAHEMNLSRYHWGVPLKEFNEKSPEIYVKLFRYVVDFFRNKSVKNALWVFCPNVDSIPDATWNKVENFYPGNEYVDILGMDGYNWGTGNESEDNKDKKWIRQWRSFEEVFQNLYKTLKKLAPHKPIIVFETATGTHFMHQTKTSWISEALHTAKKWDLKGIIWFHANKEKDWRFDSKERVSSERSFRAWLLEHVKIKNVPVPVPVPEKSSFMFCGVRRIFKIALKSTILGSCKVAQRNRFRNCFKCVRNFCKFLLSKCIKPNPGRI